MKTPLLGACALLLLVPAPVRAQTAVATDPVVRTDEVVAGGPDDAVTVRHLVVEGSQEQIGAALARIARDDLQSRPWPSADPRVTRVQERYFERVWPAQHDRMRGSAAALGGELADRSVNWSVLGYDMTGAFGCTVVFYPPEVTAGGRPVMSRNLDFTAGLANGRRPGPGERAALSRPFVVESYPDEGYASLFTCGMDLLGSAFDGLNEAGLTVALLSDRELMNEHEMIPTGELAVGLSDIQVPRYLLEKCATVEEAKDALLELRQYYAFVPCHYIVGDKTGAAFVFEASYDRNQRHFIERPGEPLITTNFMRHRNPQPRAIEAGGPKSSIGRYQAVCEQLDGAGDRFDLETIKAASQRAAFDGPPPPAQVPYAPNRTLWHALYMPVSLSLEIDFYLGEEADDRAPSGVRIRRSGYLSFSLK